MDAAWCKDHISKTVDLCSLHCLYVEYVHFNLSKLYARIMKVYRGGSLSPEVTKGNIGGPKSLSSHS